MNKKNLISIFLIALAMLLGNLAVAQKNKTIQVVNPTLSITSPCLSQSIPSKINIKKASNARSLFVKEHFWLG
jgi:hypothetical protein